MIALSVHIVTHRRLELFRRCLESVFQALPDESEVVVVANDAGTEILDYLTQCRHPQLRWVSVPKESLSVSRNRAFTLCRGRIFHYLDDDVEVPVTLFAEVLNLFASDSALSIVGGPNLTPENSSRLEKTFGAVMTSPFAAPNVCRRYSARGSEPRLATEKDLIFCNLALARQKIPRDLRFRDGLRSNQENLFLYEASERELRILASPKALVFHHRRKTVSSFARQILSYGDGRFQQSLAAPRSLEVAFAIPSLALISVPFLCLFGSNFAVFGGLLALHQALSLGISLFSPEVRSLGLVNWLMMGPLTLLVHLAYGAGFIKGFLHEVRTRLTALKPVEFSKNLGRFGA